MNPEPRSWPPKAFDMAAVLARWLLGFLFLYMGLSKAWQPVEFLKLVREYNVVQNPLFLNSIAAMLPWFEMFCGALLVAGVAVRGAASMLLLMLIPFTVVVLQRALVLQTDLSIPFCAVKFDCGCGAGEVLICRKLIENGMLMLMSAWLLTGRGQQFCARYHLLKPR